MTASVQSGVVEGLHCLSLHELCASDRVVGVGEPKAQERAVNTGATTMISALSIAPPSAARKRSAEVGSLAITRTFITSLHYLAREQNRLASMSAIRKPDARSDVHVRAPVKER